MNKPLLWENVYKSNVINRDRMFLYIQSLLELKCEVEEQGIDGFGKFLEKADAFEKFAIEAVTSGIMPDDCESILVNVLNSSGFSEDVYLKNVIFSEFVLDIQKKNIGTQELKIKLCSYLGIDGMGLLVDSLVTRRRSQP